MDKHPKDYFVPNFGMDKEIAASLKHTADQEKRLKHTWVIPKEDVQLSEDKASIPACTSFECKTETAAPHKLQKDMDKHPKDYFVPNFGMDKEIAASLKHTADQEKRLGHKWVVPPPEDVQIDEDKASIPSCNSFECAKPITAAPGHLAGLWAHQDATGAEKGSLREFSAA